MLKFKSKFALITYIIILMVFVSVLFSCGDTQSSSSSESSPNNGGAVARYTVSFDSSGGSEVASQEVEKGEKADAPLPPTKVGYTLDGWYLGEEKWSFIGYVVTSDITLVAKWAPNNNSIVYNANGGTGGMASSSGFTGSTITLSPNTFSRNGYDFCGWATSEDGDPAYQNNGSYTVGTDSVSTLYAVWKPIQYDVTYVLGLSDATNSPENPSKYTTEDTAALKSPKTDNELLEFVGWFTESNFQNAITTFNGLIGNVTLYAKWASKGDSLVFTEVEGGYSVTGCIDGVSSIVIPEEYNGFPVISIKANAFSKNSALSILTIPSSVTCIEYANYVSWKSLKEVHYLGTIQQWVSIDFDYQNPIMSGAKLYIGEELLTNLVIPEGVTTISRYAFYGCTTITEVTIPKSLERIKNDAFYGCTSIKRVNISDATRWAEVYLENKYSNPLYYDGIIYDGANAAGISEFYSSSNWNTSCDGSRTTDGFLDVFFGFWSPSAPERDGTTDDTLQYCGFKFESPISIKRSVIYVTTGSYSKFTIKALVDNEWITIDTATTDDAKIAVEEYDISALFLDFNDIVTSDIRIECTEYGKHAPGASDTDWWKVPNIIEVELITGDDGSSDKNERDLYLNGSEISGRISLANASTVRISSHFFGCEKIEEIILPRSVNYIEAYAFQGCTALKDVVSSGYFSSIGEYAFAGCSSMTSFNSCVYSINDYAFAGCSSLESINSNSIDKQIGRFAFADCTSLSKITIGTLYNGLGIGAFYNCSYLKIYTKESYITELWNINWNVSNCPVYFT